MIFEQTHRRPIGYFAAMLYNPNNVAIEASPVRRGWSWRLPGSARMIGYDPATSWGHLTSGGTVANFEALWIARERPLLPGRGCRGGRELGIELEVELPDGIAGAARPASASGSCSTSRGRRRHDLCDDLRRAARMVRRALRQALARRRSAIRSTCAPPHALDSAIRCRRRGAGRRDGALLVGEDRSRPRDRCPTARLHSGRRALPDGPGRALGGGARLDGLAGADPGVRQRVWDDGRERSRPAGPGARGAYAGRTGARHHLPLHSDAAYGGYAAALSPGGPTGRGGARRKSAPRRRPTGRRTHGFGRWKR